MMFHMYYKKDYILSHFAFWHKIVGKNRKKSAISSVVSRPHKVIELSACRQDFHQSGKRNVSSIPPTNILNACKHITYSPNQKVAENTHAKLYQRRNVGNVMFQYKNYNSISQSVLKSVLSLQIE